MTPQARFLAGACSAQIALMELLIAHEDVLAVERAVADVPALRALLASQRAGAEEIVRVLRAERTLHPDATQDQALAFQRQLFDTWVSHSEEASVALYSLGSPALLARATQEIVDWLPGLQPDHRVLDLGCGIGRMEVALHDRVAFIEGIDLSPKMVEVARRRCAAFANVHISLTDGRSLPHGRYDLVLAIDSFPYIVQAGLEHDMFPEITRVLAPGGRLVILNYAYRDDPARDREDLSQLARRHHLDVIGELGERPFQLWNGSAFTFRAA